MKIFQFTNDDDVELIYVVSVYDDYDDDTLTIFIDTVWPVFSDRPFHHAHLKGWRVNFLGSID
jgi:protein gp37